MIQPAVVAAAAAVVGAVLAVTARDARLVIMGLILAMVAAPLVSSSDPTALGLAFRILGAVLAAYLLWVAVRDRSIESEGSAIDPGSELMVAAAAFSVGWFVAPVKPLAGPVAAQAAGFALIALAIVPLAGRNVIRVGAGVFLLLLGISVLLDAWGGAGSELRQVVLTTLLLGTLGATSLLVSPVAQATEPQDAVAAVGGEAPAETTETTTPEHWTAEDSVVPAEAVDDATAQSTPVTPLPNDRAAAATPTSATSAETTEVAHDAAPIPKAASKSAPKRLSTARTSKPRSTRASRAAAPIDPGEDASPVDGSAPGPDALTEQPAQEPGRIRRIRPREQRQPRATREPRGPDR